MNNQNGSPLTRRIQQALLDMVLLIVVGLLLLAPRIPSLGQFVTADEGTWGKRSASFYYALRVGDYRGTYQTGHPGVTTMWAGAAAYAWKFPEFYRVGQLDLGDTRLLDLFINHGHIPIVLLSAARFVIALLCTAAVLAGFWFAQRLFGRTLSVMMFALLAFDPFHVAHSRFLHTNGLLASFMFLAVLAMIYFIQNRSWLALLISGAAAGLAIISITPGLMVIPSAGVILLYNLRSKETGSWDVRFANLLRSWALPLAGWGVAALFTIFLAWPSMWVRPVGTLVDTIRYGFLAASGEIGSAQFVQAYASEYDPNAKYLYFYPLSYIWRSTPPALGGLLLLVVCATFGKRWLMKILSPAQRQAAVALLVFVVVYLILMSLGSKKFDRYFLPAYLPLDMLAMLGWFAAAHWVAERWQWLSRSAWLVIVPGTVIILQAAGTLNTFPYYNTYFNPVLGGLPKATGVMSVGWGEGLHMAAQYLNQQPDIQHKKIASWYTLSFNWYSASFGFRAMPQDISDQTPLATYLESDYIVVYINQAQRHYPAELMDYLESLKPVYTARIQGVEFAWVYALDADRP